MENKIKKLFKVEFDKTKRSWKNFDHTVDFTASCGWIYPFETMEVLPGDHLESDVMIYVQTNPLQSPLLSSLDCKCEAFFIPTRLYVQSLDQNNMSIAFDGDTPLPYIVMPNGVTLLSGWPKQTMYADWPDFEDASEYGLLNSSTSIFTMLGMVPPFNSAAFGNNNVSTEFRFNAVPFVGYYDIYRNYYANPHDTLGVPFRLGDLVTYNVVGGDYRESGRYICDGYVDLKRFDSFINMVTLGSLDISNPADPTPVAYNVQTAWFKAFTKFDVPAYAALVGVAPGTVYMGDEAVPLFNRMSAASVLDTSVEGSPVSHSVWIDNRTTPHLGLLRRTYNDDYFTAFFANEYVDYQESTAAVTVTNGRFSVQQLRFQNRLARFIDRNLLSNFRYGGYLNVHFGVSLGDKICKPIYLGRRRFKLTFNDIISSTEGDASSVSDNKSLGSRAALGSGFQDFSRNMFELDSSEYGYIIWNFSIIPNVCYWQGIEKWCRKLTLGDLYIPEFDGYGYEDVSYIEYNAHKPQFFVGSGVQVSSSGFVFQDVDVVKHPAYMEYMVTWDKVKGLFQDDQYYSNWFFNRTFTDQIFQPTSYKGYPNDMPYQLSTYIYPEAYDSIFPVQRDLDNYQVHVRFKTRVKRCMSGQILPSL